MKRYVTTLPKAAILAGLVVLFCTKVPSDMDTLEHNIGATSLVAPADGSTDNTLTPQLLWQSVDGALRYHVQVSTESDFSTIAFEDTAVTDTVKVAGIMKYKTMYYWRVQVHDATSFSEWTSHRIFTTIIEPMTPVSGAPKDSMKGVPTSLVLTWNAASGAASYCVQVSPDTDFKTIEIADSTLADTSKVLSNLANSRTYYWRVRSQNPGGVSAWTGSRSFTTIVAAPKAPGLVVPVSGATNQQLSLALTWNNVPEASFYYLQVATDIAFINIFIQDSTLTDTSKSIAGLANAVQYFWRVKAKNEGGTSAWSTFFGFTTFAAVPQQPVLNLPADGAVDQAIPLTVNWNKSTGAASYHLQIATDSGFTAMSFVDSAMVDTSKSMGGLANNTKYFWRVRAKNPVGVSSWSVKRSFTTFSAALPIPVLRLPADGATGQPTAPVLRWQSVSGALKYRIQISVNSDFSTISSQDSGLTDTTKTLSALVNNTVYFWRVRAENATGFGNWATPWHFTTVLAAPQIPALVAPADGASAQPLSLALFWNKAAGAATYSLQVATDSNFATTVAGDSALADTSKIITLSLNNTTYYWRVSSKNAAGGSGWSGRRSFVTFDAKLPLPTLTMPQDGSKDLSLTPSLSWSTAEGASTYEVQVSTTRDFTTVVIDDATPTSGSKSLGAGVLLNSTTYFWRVMAKNLSGAASNWTDPWSFTTIITTPGTPTLVFPNDNAGSRPVSLSLTWNKATGAATYYVKVSSDTGFTATNVVSADSTLTDTAKAITGLSNGTTYYWKVKGRNSSGDGSWSAFRSFTTIIAAPMSTVLSSPADSAANVNLNPQLSWSAVTGAAAYHIQVSTAPDFLTGLVVDDSTYTQTTKLIGPLSVNTRYYWHVQARNAGGTSTWSSRWSFTTVPPPPAVPRLVAPADGASDMPRTPTLMWNRTSGAEVYYVQAATDTGFVNIIKTDSTVSPADTSLALVGLSNATQYYWRVQAKNTGGSTWSMRKGFATIVAAPAAPKLVSPQDSAQGMPLNSTLVWNVASNASAYQVEIAADSATKADSSFMFIVKRDSTLSAGDTSKTIDSLTIGTVYYWHVRAKNKGGVSAWSARRSFSTLVGLPSLEVPSHKGVNVPVNAQFKWVAVSCATSYRLQVAKDVSFNLVSLDTTLSYIVVDVPSPLSKGTAYYWRVRASNAGGDGDWALDSFTTIPPPPPTPVLVSPAHNAMNVSTTPVLQWRKIIGVTQYRLTVGVDTLFSPATYDNFIYAVNDTSKTLSGLDSDKKYYWRVVAYNDGGNTRTIDSFTTGLTAPVLQSPNDGAGNVPLRPALSWTAASGASTYRVQVSTAPDFTNGILYDDSTIAGTATAANVIGPLSMLSSYFWRVNAKNAGGTSPWSSGRSFTTAGLSWTAVNSGLTGTQIYTIAETNGKIFVGTFSTGVFVSSDNGSSWSASGSGMTDLDVFAVRQVGSVLLTGTMGHLYRSTDAGATWTEVPGTSGSAWESFAVKGTTIFAGMASSGIYVSTDDGATFSVSNSGLPTPINYNIWCIEVFGNIVYACLQGHGIYKSSDNGATWTQANTGISSTSTVYGLDTIGSDIFASVYGDGVAVSSNSGASWALVGTGLTDKNIHPIVSSKGFLYVGTNGNGVFASTDRGLHWAAVKTNMPANTMVDALRAIDTNLFAGSNGNGMFRAVLP